KPERFINAIGRFEDAPYGLGLDLFVIGKVHVDHFEFVDQLLQRIVGAPVVDDNYLELGIVQGEEGAYVLDNRHALVEGGGDDGDARGEGGAHELSIVLVG